MSDYNFARYLSQIQGAQDPDELAAMQFDQPGLIDRGRGATNDDYLKLLQFQKAKTDELYGRQAAPVAKMLAQFAATGNDADPNFSGDEWVKGMATTYPVDGKTMSEDEYDAALAGDIPAGEKGATPLSAFAVNPVTADLLQKAELSAQQKGTTIKDLRDISDNVMSGNNPPSMALARFLATGGEKSTNQLKTMADLAKQNDEVIKARGRQGWVNAGGSSPDTVTEPRLRTIMGSAPYGVTLEDLNKMTEITGVVPKWKTVDTGTGQGEQRQVVTFDERTGQEGGRVGDPWLPSAPKITNNLTYNGDKKGIESLVSKLPEYMDSAQTAYSSKLRIGKMMNLINTGAAGAQGYAKSVIAPTLNLLGIETQGLSDAQLYQTLAKGMAGSLRSSIVGPGAVSNYEQDLLKSVSGGGTTGAAAAKELLTYYSQEADRKINTYNSTLNSVANVAPETAKAFKRIDLQGNNPNGNKDLQSAAAAELARRKKGKR